MTIFRAIGEKESSNNPKAFNEKEGAIGIVQIRKIALQDANRILGKETYKEADCWDIAKSYEIFKTLQDHYNPSWDYETAAKLWNGGPKWAKKEGVKKYWLDVLNIL